jgi:glycosyltransferase involved in cell wall biosynthesis
MPQASPVVVNYNGKECIINCLGSIEGQSFKNFEAIVVNNGSSDNLLGKVRGFLKGTQ